MNRSIAIAYTVAAAATALALVVVIGSTVGFEDEADESHERAERFEHGAPGDVPAALPADPNVANRTAALNVTDEPVVVYEDAPPRARGWGDDDEEEEHEREEHEDEEHEEHEREEHEGRRRHD